MGRLEPVAAGGMSSARSLLRDSPAAESPEMEPRIWSNLPQHLLELILALLPLTTLLGLRSTCKHFNSLLFSPSFLSLIAKSRAPLLSSYLVLSHPQFPLHSFSLFDPFLGRWRMLSVPFPAHCGPMTLIASSHGLLCFSSSGSFLVANLVTKSWKQIDFPTDSFTSPSLFSSTSGFYLCVLSDSPNPYSSVFVYDSRGERWRKFGGFGSVSRQGAHQEGVCANGCRYFTTPEPFSVVGVDLQTGKWGRPAPLLPPGLTFVRIVSGGNRIYLVGGVGGNGISRSLNVWELVDEEGKWLAVGALPELMCRKFLYVCYHNYNHVYCFFHESRLWQESFISLCCYTWPEVLVYKVARRTWNWLPRCPALPKKPSCCFRWFSFVPNLHATV